MSQQLKDVDEKEFLWVEKYRPQTIDDCVLPERYKKIFKDFVKQKEIPNMLLCGGAGVGKTTIARALGNELGADVMVINASEQSGIDVLRNEIKQFASTMSLMGGTKIIILDEADYLNANSTQPAMRNFMESFSKNCRFILTANFANRIIEPLHSRLTTVEFNITQKEFPKMASEFMGRVRNILNAEGVKFAPKVVGEIITRYFPDYRKTLNELQKNSASGELMSMPEDFDESAVAVLVEFLRNKEFGKMRKWVTDHKDMDPLKIMRGLLDQCNNLFEGIFIPDLIMLYNTYDYRHAFVADKEINLLAFLTEVMLNAKFK